MPARTFALTLVLAALFLSRAAVAQTAPSPDEAATYQRARPVFERYCTACHARRGASPAPEALEHLAMDAYPFGGHHAAEAGAAIREALGATGTPATMPEDHPGAVTGSELTRVLAWADAFDRAHPAGSPTASDHAEHPHAMDPVAMTQGPLGLSWSREGSGTAWQPDATPMFGHVQYVHGWSLMEHYNVFAGYDAMDGPRGSSGFFSTNWAMLMVRHELGGGQLGARAMLSLEAATLPDGGYPLLLQTGETYRGAPLHDRQHPHDLFMELALHYQRAVGGGAAVELYVAPAGEPALGPVAFPHRMSALYDPLGPISHHWLDATHISFGVVTAALYTRYLKLEGSWFNGREPDEDRWGFDFRVPDSWSARLTVNPAPWLSAQASYGFLRSPEALRPEESVHRLTASVTTSVALGASHWATTAAWGMNAATGRRPSSALLVESSLNLFGHVVVYGRAEYVAKSAEDLALASGNRDALFDVGGLALGVAYTFPPLAGLVAAVGVRGALGLVPGELVPLYGASTPVGGVVYLQLRPAAMAMGPMAMGGR